MKTKSSYRRKSARIKAARWSAYATAGAATALGSPISAEGNITYSGLLNRHFGFTGGPDVISYFPLDQPGDVLVVQRNSFSTGLTQPFGAAFVGLRPTIVSGAIAGFQGYNFIASKLAFGANISAQHFGFYFGDLGRYSGASETSVSIPWAQPGNGFVGFRFDGGAGKQYGWVRITMEEGAPAYTFTLVDFAFADPGQRIRVGETGVPDSGGSLGLLAIGCAGLLAWRGRRVDADS